MALRTWTVREALEGSIARLTPLQIDVRLAAAEQALAGELRQVDQQALNILRADNTIQPNQRNARATAIDDKARALGVVEDAHNETIGVDELYNALDLSTDAAQAIRLGLPTFVSDISTVQE